ncbi:MAG TPA: hypothetical protein VK489_09285 [Ferruginibacter sp.]|nr:hypothetical protein [Ferruginibacter sp.]
MKKRRSLYITLFFSVVVALSSCFHDHDMSITVRDDDDAYRFRASFDEDQTRTVHRIIKSHLHNAISFNRSFVETDARLDDGTSVHIKSRPGRLRIDFDRSDNSEENFGKLLQMCDEIKEALAGEADNNY